MSRWTMLHEFSCGLDWQCYEAKYRADGSVKYVLRSEVLQRMGNAIFPIGRFYYAWKQLMARSGIRASTLAEPLATLSML